MSRLKHFVFDFYIPIGIVGVVIALWVLNRATFDAQATAITIGSGLSFLYFVQKQKLEELELFNRLFVGFNEKYDGVNEKLRTILHGETSSPLTRDECEILTDYFNLCAEEFFFYKHGLVYPEVWRAWRNGMQVYFGNSRIREFWKDEMKTDSYYGFTP